MNIATHCPSLGGAAGCWLLFQCVTHGHGVEMLYIAAWDFQGCSGLSGLLSWQRLEKFPSLELVRWCDSKKCYVSGKYYYNRYVLVVIKSLKCCVLLAAFHFHSRASPVHSLPRALKTGSCFYSIKVSKGTRDPPFLLCFFSDFFFGFVSFLNVSCQIGSSPFFTSAAQFSC